MEVFDSQVFYGRVHVHVLDIAMWSALNLTFGSPQEHAGILAKRPAMSDTEENIYFVSTVFLTFLGHDASPECHAFHEPRLAEGMHKEEFVEEIAT